MPPVRLAILAVLAVAAFSSVPALAAPPAAPAVFVGAGIVEISHGGSSRGECIVAVDIASEPDGGWSISGIRTALPVVQYCNMWCCHTVAYYPGATDARGDPATGFEGEGVLLGIHNVVRVGPLGPATAFELVQWSELDPTNVWTVRGELTFAPA